jgi:hypothetical protein
MPIMPCGGASLQRDRRGGDPSKAVAPRLVVPGREAGFSWIMHLSGQLCGYWIAVQSSQPHRCLPHVGYMSLLSCSATNMASKRDQDQVFDVEVAEEEVLDPEPRMKRHRAADQSRSQSAQQNADTDPTTGQRYAFGGLDDASYATVPFDEELDVEDEQDALAYLRSVRYVFSHPTSVNLQHHKLRPLPPKARRAEC